MSVRAEGVPSMTPHDHRDLFGPLRERAEDLRMGLRRLFGGNRTERPGGRAQGERENGGDRDPDKVATEHLSPERFTVSTTNRIPSGAPE